MFSRMAIGDWPSGSYLSSVTLPHTDLWLCGGVLMQGGLRNYGGVVGNSVAVTAGPVRNLLGLLTCPHRSTWKNICSMIATSGRLRESGGVLSLDSSQHRLT